MSQRYAQAPKPRPASPAPVDVAAEAPDVDSKETDFGLASTSHEPEALSTDDKEREVKEHESVYAHNRDSLITAIDQTTTILDGLRVFNSERWVVHYPEVDRRAGVSRSQSSQPGSAVGDDQQEASQSSSSAAPQHPGLNRASTTVGSSSLPNSPRKALVRSQTSVAPAAGDDDSDEMSVLRLDLKLGAVTSNPQALVHALEKSSVAQLLEDRMRTSLRQLSNLRQRISETQSKVLVTGDLNAGKSTFVNALLRRRVMPIDQQPCTTVFCEVLDAGQLNKGVEEVHMIQPGTAYNAADDSTFTRHTLADIEQIVADAEDINPEDAPMLKCYCHDTRAAQESLLRNGVVDIALIDAPGLNRDSLKTTALFARQEEIDVVVFVVSAENHFTLSAKEFLWNASNDKAYVFIVVNKYDQIRNKDKCRRLVLEQIKQLSPRTYEDAEELVHFVDSSAVFGDDGKQELQPSFARLEASLRDFVLLKRNKSKLMPAQTYLLRLLSDIDFLARTNSSVAASELEEARAELEIARPALEQCKASHASVEAALEGEEDAVIAGILDDAKKTLDEAIDAVARGDSAHASVELPEYPGLLAIWDYARAVRLALSSSIEASLRSVEDSARNSTASAVNRIKDMGEKALPSDADECQRVFLPERMFFKRRATGPGAVGLGLGAELVEPKLTDLFDAKHHFLVITGSPEAGDEGKAAKDQDEELSYVNGFGFGLALILGGKTLGARTAIEAFMRVSRLAQSRWAKPAFVVLSGAAVYWFVTELPVSVRRNVGRDQARLLRNAETKFSATHSARVGRQSRKVIRMAGWDLNERFRSALAKRRADVEREEAKEKSALEAQEWFGRTRGEVATVRSGVSSLQGWD